MRVCCCVVLCRIGRWSASTAFGRPGTRKQRGKKRTADPWPHVVVVRDVMSYEFSFVLMVSILSCPVLCCAVLLSGMFSLRRRRRRCLNNDVDGKGVRVVRVEADGERKYRAGSQGRLGRGDGRSQGPSICVLCGVHVSVSVCVCTCGSSHLFSASRFGAAHAPTPFGM